MRERGPGPSTSTHCRCASPKPGPTRATWRVVDRECNYSAFSGYRWTPSAYSLVVCARYLGGCGGTWRTKARYVDGLHDIDRRRYQAEG